MGGGNGYFANRYLALLMCLAVAMRSSMTGLFSKVSIHFTFQISMNDKKSKNSILATKLSGIVKL